MLKTTRQHVDTATARDVLDRIVDTAITGHAFHDNQPEALTSTHTCSRLYDSGVELIRSTTKQPFATRHRKITDADSFSSISTVVQRMHGIQN